VEAVLSDEACTTVLSHIETLTTLRDLKADGMDLRFCRGSLPADAEDRSHGRCQCRHRCEARTRGLTAPRKQPRSVLSRLPLVADSLPVDHTTRRSIVGQGRLGASWRGTRDWYRQR
jgi:hypothetical protein